MDPREAATAPRPRGHPPPAARRIYPPPFYLDNLVFYLDKMGGGIPFCVFI